jgi:putative endonuclease
MNDWFVYILRCSDDSLYTGITTELDRRVAEHNDKNKKLGARYTRSRQPVTLIYHETFESRSLASKREAEIKRLKRKQKLLLIASSKAPVQTT